MSRDQTIGAWQLSGDNAIGAYAYEWPLIVPYSNPVNEQHFIGALGRTNQDSDIGAYQTGLWATSTRLPAPVSNDIGALAQSSDGTDIGAWGRFLGLVTYEESVTFSTIADFDFIRLFLESLNFNVDANIPIQEFADIPVNVSFDSIHELNRNVSITTFFINTTSGRLFVVTEEDRVYEIYLPERSKTIR